MEGQKLVNGQLFKNSFSNSSTNSEDSTPYTKMNITNSDKTEIELNTFNYEKEQPVNDNCTLNIEQNSKSSILSLNINRNFFYKRIGNTFAFFGDKNGNPKIIIGPHWPMYLCFCSMMTIGFFSLFCSFWGYFNIYLKISGIFTFLLFFCSYTYIFLANPGIPEINENSILGQPRNKYKFCRECKIWVSVDKRVEHCFDCNVCVQGYDHHCPWTGKCIGEKNIYCFYAFLASILISFFYLALSLAFASNKYEKIQRQKKNGKNLL